MSIVITNVERVSPTVLVVSWTATAGETTFWVWYNGRFLGSTSETSYAVVAGPSEGGHVDVFGSSAEVPEGYPGKVRLEAEVEDGTVQYQFWEKVSGNYVLRQAVPANVAPVVRFLSRFLEDGEIHEFKVVGVDAAGDVGVEREVAVRMVRYPDPANLTAAYLGSATGTFRVSVKPSGAVTGAFG